jgi:hypothetical protein
MTGAVPPALLRRQRAARRDRARAAGAAVPRLSVSIAMATHNGERFLPEQLYSLAAQTRLPAELVVYDDCSSDGTLEILRRFAAGAPFPVRLLEGEVHVGFVEALLTAAAACRGELIAFCDQDDVWLAEKLARCVSEFEREPQLSMVVHSGALIDSAGDRLPGAYPAFRRRRVLAPRCAPLYPVAPGFALVMTRRCIEPWDLVANSTTIRWFTGGHDTRMAFVATTLGKLALLPERLVLYRQHGANVCGALEFSLAERALSSARRVDPAGEFRETVASARERATLLGKLQTQLAGLPGGESSTARKRAVLYERLATRYQRRSELYQCPGRLQPLLRLAANLLRGDYAFRDPAGLGPSRFACDLIHILGATDLIPRALRAAGRSQGGL